MALLKAPCDSQLQVFLDVCKAVNFPISLDKTFWGCTQMTFLGFFIDTIMQTVTIPAEKVMKAEILLVSILNKQSKKMTVK